MNLVTLDEAKQHLYIDGSAHDSWLTLFIAAVSQAVALWVKDEDRLFVPEFDSNGDPVPGVDVKPIVKAAVLLELSSGFRFREGEGKDNVVPSSDGHGYVLNKTSTALLTPLRKPTVA